MNPPVEGEADIGSSLVKLSASASAAVRRHAVAMYPEEACGGLLGREDGSGQSQVLAVLPVTNTQPEERHRRYLIGAADVLSLERRARASNLEVVGFYHSHPDARALPSTTDREHAWPWYVYLIVSVSCGDPTQFRAWRLADDRRAFTPIEIRLGSG